MGEGEEAEAAAMLRKRGVLLICKAGLGGLVKESDRLPILRELCATAQ